MVEAKDFVEVGAGAGAGALASWLLKPEKKTWKELHRLFREGKKREAVIGAYETILNRTPSEKEVRSHLRRIEEHDWNNAQFILAFVNGAYGEGELKPKGNWLPKVY